MQHAEIAGEVGSNFGGSLEEAKRYIQRLAQAGATAAKFQALRKDTLVAPKVFSEGKWIPNPVLDVFANLELPAEWHQELKDCPDAAGIGPVGFIYFSAL